MLAVSNILHSLLSGVFKSVDQKIHIKADQEAVAPFVFNLLTPVHLYITFFQP